MSPTNSPAHNHADYSALVQLTELLDCVIAADSRGNITAWNKVAEELLGWKEEEVLGRELAETIIPAQYIEAHRAGIRAYHKTGRGPILNRRIEITAKHRDGHEVPVELAVTTSGARGFIAVLRDLSARYDEEQAMRFRAQILDQIGDSVILTDLRGNIKSWNKSAENLYGYTEKETVGRNLALLLPIGTEENQGENIVTPSMTEDVRRSNVVKRKKNGEMVEVHLTLSPLRDERGVAAGYIHCSADISARMKAERQLRESESKYRTIVDTAQEGIWVLDAEARTSFVNRRMCEMLGYTAEEFAGAHLLEFMDEKGRLEAEENLKRRKEGVTESHEFRFKHKNGTDVWTLIATNPFHDEEGEYIGTLGMISDISELKNREREIRRNNEILRRKNSELETVTRKFQELYHDAPCGYHSLDKNGVIVEMNRTELNWLGYTRREMEGKLQGKDILTEDSRRKFAEVFPRLLRDGYVRDIEYDFTRKDGTIMPVSLSASVVRDDEGNFIQARASVVDVTDRKKAQEQLAARRMEIERLNDSLEEQVREALRKNTELKIANEKYRELYHGAPCGYHTLNEKGFLVDMNRTELNWLGYEWEELDGKVRSVDLLTESSRKKFATVFPRMIEAGFIQDEEFEFMRKDGSVLPVAISAVTSVDENGEFFRAHASIVDITDRKRVQEQLAARSREIETLNANLEERVQEELRKNRQKDLLLIQQSRFASMGEMIGNIAHQWRQPLNAIYLLLNNIKDAFDYDEMDDAFMEECLTRGRTLVTRMSDTIDDFRNFFKPNKERTRFSVEQSVRDAISIVESEFKYRNIETEIKDGPVSTEGFPNEYAQVILNLLKNSRDAIVDNNIKNGRIRIEVRVENQRAITLITDNGGGIPEGLLSRIFDPYFTTRDAGKGTGIGLYMSKMIVEDHMRGSLEIRNISGGTEARVVTAAA